MNPQVPLRELLPAICEKCEFEVQNTVLLRTINSEEPLDLNCCLNDLRLSDLGPRELYARDTRGKNSRTKIHIQAVLFVLLNLYSVANSHSILLTVYSLIFVTVNSPTGSPPSPTPTGNNKYIDVFSILVSRTLHYCFYRNTYTYLVKLEKCTELYIIAIILLYNALVVQADNGTG